MTLLCLLRCLEIDFSLCMET
eukprot:COSAG05_NODE_11193_length_525_cov_2.096244_1_plen_20_part_10